MRGGIGRWVWRLAVGAVAVSVLVGRPHETGHDRTTDERIAFYRARVGGPGTYPSHAGLGRAYLDKYRETGATRYYDAALRHLRQSLSYQRNFGALFGLALALSERHSFKEALPFAEEAVEALPTDPEAGGVRFDILLALGRVTEAERQVNAMLAVRAGFQALARQAALREYRGDYAGAVEALVQARDEAIAVRRPKTTIAWTEVRIGALWIARCDAAKAREAYDRALALLPNYFFAREHLAEWHAAQGRWREAEQLYRALLKDHPEAQYRLALAEVCRSLGNTRGADREEAKATQTMLRELRAGAQDQYRPLALASLNRPETAADGLRWAKADWEVREDALTADTLAWAHHQNGNGPDAVRFSELALQSGSKSPTILLHAGLIRCRHGSAESGRDLLRQALTCPLNFNPHDRTLAELARTALAGER